MTERASSSMRYADVVREAIATIAAAPYKSLATGIGILLAAAAFVTTLGLSSTLSDQVSSAFDEARSTEVVVTVDRETQATPGAMGDPCPQLDVANARSLAGVSSAGLLQTVADAAVARAVGSYVNTSQVAVAGVDAQALSAIQPDLLAGRAFDQGNVARADPVALVPSNVASALGVVGVGDSVTVGDTPLVVTGIFDDVVRRPETLNTIIVPNTLLARLVGPSADLKCQVELSTDSGAAANVAAQVAVALSPAQPERLNVAAPPDPKTFRRTLEAPIRNLSLALAGAVLVLGVVSIATTAATSVAARSAEIGLRKALGARPVHVLGQLTIETSIIGLLGAFVGVIVGSAAVLVVAAINNWAPVIDLRAAVVATVGGAALGAAAGLLPGVRAARLPAVEALRR